MSGSGQPKRIQRTRRKGDQIPPDAVYVGRHHHLIGWGNPYRVGETVSAAWVWVADWTLASEWRPVHDDRPIDVLVVDAAHAVALFEKLVASNPDYRREVRARLAGRDLACWCKVGDPCHGDVLLRVANCGAP